MGTDGTTRRFAFAGERLMQVLANSVIRLTYAIRHSGGGRESSRDTTCPYKSLYSGSRYRPLARNDGCRMKHLILKFIALFWIATAVVVAGLAHAKTITVAYPSPSWN